MTDQKNFSAVIGVELLQRYPAHIRPRAQEILPQHLRARREEHAACAEASGIWEEPTLEPLGSVVGNVVEDEQPLKGNRCQSLSDALCHVLDTRILP
eukprot:scaffold1128_cov170-Pinguiococcus_pyrenoidosus.AAC.1